MSEWPAFDPSVRQLLHVGFKIAAMMGYRSHYCSSIRKNALGAPQSALGMLNVRLVEAPCDSISLSTTWGKLWRAPDAVIR
jgi:hypothetical protein